jgi:hypothetical protein
MEEKEYKNLIDFIAEALNISSYRVTNSESLSKVMGAAEFWAEQLGEFVFENKESFTNAEDAVEAFYMSCKY